MTFDPLPDMDGYDRDGMYRDDVPHKPQPKPPVDFHNLLPSDAPAARPFDATGWPVGKKKLRQS